ncbi:hypothetical protein B2G71_17210 [Novosphingobium sp. PC22D]|uniref:oxidoreductase n=1 Tax=Novosphingobium sp. PC22D TaxID=1962403 RepID=UPI000BF1D71B|nr:12-oxophytodienoate reductase [Novosphingobium sp. PC22D]PEQ11304.1 hypothetical protein B2G71_17210 [Novosphingobium sp. PC22D]
MVELSPLLSPFSLGRLTVRNRVVMAPMTREMSPGGVPGPDVRDYYARRARGGVGLIITEGASVDLAGSFGSRVPRLYGRDAIAAWREVVSAVHDEGAAIFAQLWHVGAFSPSLIGMVDTLPADVARLSPSGLAAPDRPFGRAMTEADIAHAVAAFAAAAAAAQDAGFDGIEVHGAHGYLPDQFMWEGTNLRDDRYGGTIEARMHFPVELVEAIRRRTGNGFVIGFRLSQWKQLDYAARLAPDPDTLALYVRPLAEAGVDVFHASTRRFWEPEFPGDPRNLAGWVRALGGRPVITVGSVTLDVDFKAPSGKLAAKAQLDHLAMLEDGLARQHFDLIAIGRSLLANPDWVHRLERSALAGLEAFDRTMIDKLN